MRGIQEHLPDDDHFDATDLCVCPCDDCTTSLQFCVCSDCRCESAEDHYQHVWEESKW